MQISQKIEIRHVDQQKSVWFKSGLNVLYTLKGFCFLLFFTCKISLYGNLTLVDVKYLRKMLVKIILCLQNVKCQGVVSFLIKMLFS